MWCVVCVFVCGVREDPDEGPGGAGAAAPFGRGAHGGGGGARVGATPEELELAAMLQGLQAAAAAEQARQAQWQSPAAAAGAAAQQRADDERMRAELERSMANLSDDERREAMEQLAAVAVLGGLLAGATLGLAAEQHVQQQQPGAAPRSFDLSSDAL